MTRSSVARPSAPAWDCCKRNPSAVIEFANGEAMTVCRSCASTVPASHRHPLPIGPMPVIPVTLGKHFHVTVNGDNEQCVSGIPAAIAALKAEISRTRTLAPLTTDELHVADVVLNHDVVTPDVVMRTIGGLFGYYGSYAVVVGPVEHRIAYCPEDTTCEARNARIGQTVPSADPSPDASTAVGANPIACQCENSACSHSQCTNPVPADAPRMVYVGEVCVPCARTMAATDPSWVSAPYGTMVAEWTAYPQV